jgi:hypothetical protein
MIAGIAIGIAAITIATAGAISTKKAAQVHTQLGRTVYSPSPPDQCGDWNDFLILIADRDGRDVLPLEVSEDAA